MNKPTIVKDAAGNVLSLRYGDGWGWDKTYDDSGNELSFRHTDGTGWDHTYDGNGNTLSYRRLDGTGWDKTYDDNGNELSFRHTDGTGWDYTYDESGNELSHHPTNNDTHPLEVPIDQAAVRKALIETLGLSMVATFVPFSKSRNAKPNPRFNDLCINWKCSMLKNGREFLTADYMQGLAHVPGYKSSMRPTIHNAYFMREAVEENRHFFDSHVPVAKFKKLSLPPIDDVLYALIMDSKALDHINFESWASDYGYDTDSRADETTYRVCLNTGLKMQTSLGSGGMQRLQEAFQDYYNESDTAVSDK